MSTIGPNHNTSENLPKENESSVWKLSVPHLYGSWLIIDLIWNQLQGPQTDDWIKTLWCVYTMESNSAVERVKAWPAQVSVCNWRPLCLVKYPSSKSTKTICFPWFVIMKIQSTRSEYIWAKLILWRFDLCLVVYSYSSNNGVSTYYFSA